MRTDTEAVRDRLLAVLREADDWISTKQVAIRAGGWMRFTAHHSINHMPGSATAVIDCNGRYDLIAVSLFTASRGWRELCALEKDHKVARLRRGDDPNVYWMLARDPATLDPGPLLEALWHAPAYEAPDA